MERTAIIIGAGRGLGLGFARGLLARPAGWAVVATARDPASSDGLVRLREQAGPRLTLGALDVRDEASIAACHRDVSEKHPEAELLVYCPGVLHDEAGLFPERRLDEVHPEQLLKSFTVNAFGALLVAKHFAPRLVHGRRAVLANVSAHVGSIAENRLGGWYGYRGSKAALNMFTKTLSVELGRRSKALTCVTLHPGPMDTDLGAPFHRHAPAGKVFPPDQAARQLLDLIEGLRPEDSGGFYSWDGSPIPW